MTLVEFLNARWDEEDNAWVEHDTIPAGCWGPERVAAELYMKRRILLLGMYQPAAHVILREMASIYALHPDYDEAWRPSSRQ